MSFGMSYGVSHTANRTQRYKPNLSIVFPLILCHEDWVFEYQRGIQKIYAVFIYVLLTFLFVPLEFRR